ncbi:hypothetical protein FRB99_005249 [Tulasnella sp. 403]|nr:hypothetical protein FRB99_005249 [Tulasnella sp. 403]
MATATLTPGLNQPLTEPSSIQVDQETVAKVVDFYQNKFDNIKSSFSTLNTERHLTLLRAIHALLTKLSQNIPGGPITLEDIRARTPLVNLVTLQAVYRYHLWLSGYLRNRQDTPGPLGSDELPPLDVMSAWITHLLTPFQFKEDEIRRVPALRHITQFPLDGVDNVIDPKTGEYHPSAAQRERWTQSVKLPFDPWAVNDTIDITCPRCNTITSSLWVESSSRIPTKEGKGFGEEGFTLPCGSCDLVLTHDVLRTGKFLWDYKRCIEDEKEVFFGTLLDEKGAPDLQSARELVKLVVSALPPQSQNLGNDFSWALERIGSALQSVAGSDVTIQKQYVLPKWMAYQFISSFDRITSLVRAYRGPTIAMDEPHVAAVVHMGTKLYTFVLACHEEGYLHPGILGSDQLNQTLENAILSYRNYLCRLLVPEWRRGLRAPGQAADIVWHTHQLLGKTYRSGRISAQVFPALSTTYIASPGTIVKIHTDFLSITSAPIRLGTVRREVLVISALLNPSKPMQEPGPNL